MARKLQIISVLLLMLAVCGCPQRSEVDETPQHSTLTVQTRDRLPLADGPVMFQDVSADWNVDFINRVTNQEDYLLSAITGSGCAIVDVDQDGMLDILFAGMAEDDKPANALYRQVNLGVFENVTVDYGLEQAPPSMGIGIGDCNNDGWPDIYLASHHQDTLWLNNKGQHFSDVTDSAGLGNIRWGTAVSWVDYDRDGWLDLFVTNYVDYLHRPCIRLGGGDIDYCSPRLFQGTADKVFHNVTGSNSGVPTFEDVTEKSGVGALTGAGLGVMAADFTGDGWVDFYVANDQEANRLWVNQKNGTFLNEAVLRGCAVGSTGKPQASMGLAIADLNSDQLEDLLISHLSQESHALYLGQPGGLYHEESFASGIASATLPETGFGIAIEDFDHDGVSEIMTANGHVKRSNEAREDKSHFWQPYQQQLQILQKLTNQQYGPFDAVRPEIPSAVSRGLACGDLDRDGDIDVVVSNTASLCFILENVAVKKGQWLIVRPFDPAHHGRPALGAKLTAISSGKNQVRTFQPCASYASSHAPEVHFTCENGDIIQQIEVIWPDGAFTPERFHVDQMNTVLDVHRGAGMQVSQ